MSTPLVSICMPNLNTLPFLVERMESILAQTVRDWELIVCDSHSDDGAWEFLQKFKGDARMKLHQVPREGIYAGWNECLRRATGEFVYMATSDDTAVPTLLECLLSPLRARPEISLAACDVQEIDEAGKSLDRQGRIRSFFGKWMTTPSIRNGKTEFLLHACFGPTWVSMTTVLFRRKLVQDGLSFRTDLGSVADAEWAMRASLASDIAFVPGRLATWRVHAGQASEPVRSREVLQTLLSSTESVLRDDRSGIPPSWKTVPDWDGRITSVWRGQYYESFGLYRGMAKQQPSQFLRNFCDALWSEPSLLLSQVFNGFSRPRDKFCPDPREVAAQLIQVFEASWPPRAVAGDWA